MKRAIRSLLWPRYTAVDPNIVNRAVRVLHWITTAVAPFLVLLLLLGSIDLGPSLMAGVVLLLTGRAVRYILSAE